MSRQVRPKGSAGPFVHHEGIAPRPTARARMAHRQPQAKPWELVSEPSEEFEFISEAPKDVPRVEPSETLRELPRSRLSGPVPLACDSVNRLVSRDSDSVRPTGDDASMLRGERCMSAVGVSERRVWGASGPRLLRGLWRCQLLRLVGGPRLPG